MAETKSGSGRDRTWLPDFSLPSAQWNLFVVVTVLIFMALVTFLTKNHWWYVFTFFLAVVWYATACNQLATRGQPAPEGEVVAEQVTVFGVASLIVHIVFAGLSFHDKWRTDQTISHDAVWIAATGFLGGLACAAIAPVVAVVARSLRQTPDDAFALPGSAAGINQLGMTPISMGTDAPGVSEAHRLSEVIRRTAEEFERASQRLIAAMDNASQGIAGGAERAKITLEGFSSSMDERSGALRDAMTGLSESLTAQKMTVADSLSVVAEAIRTRAGAIPEALSDAAGSLSDVAEGIRTRAGAIPEALSNAAGEIRGAGRPVVGSLLDVTKSIEASSGLLTRTVDTLTNDVAAQAGAFGRGIAALEAQFQTLQQSLGRIEADVGAGTAALSTALDTASKGTRELGSEMEVLAKKLVESGILLQGLQSLIQSVRRFISPDDTPAVSRRQESVS